ncbi:MAG: iron-sulfur cluster assembly accessory protein [Cyanobacteria bacterium P01_D01_bin.71]
MIHLSQSAIRELKRLEANEPYGSGVVRLAVLSGGCAGLMYDLQFRQAAKATDQILKIDHLKVVIAIDQLANCNGLAIDYSEDLTGGNFRFANPLAKQTCGCGVSFSLEEPAPNQSMADCTQAEGPPLLSGRS